MLAGEAGLRGDSGVISMIQQQYGLDEQELEAFLEYSESALQADRDYQRELQNQVCNRRTEFQTLNSFGLALNEIDRKAEEHQESLGRQAEQALGLALFSKINNVLLREPPKEVTVSDFPVLFAGLDLDLHEQIERFCGILE